MVTGDLDPVDEPNPFWAHRMGLPITTVFVVFLIASRWTIATGFAAIIAVFATASNWMIGLFRNSMSDEDIWNSFSDMMPVCALFGWIGALSMQVFFLLVSRRENRNRIKEG